MATKLGTKNGGARSLPGGKRMTFEGGKPKSTGRGLPIKTASAS